MRLTLFLVLAVLLAGYAFWVYARVELSVRGGRRLALLRAAALVLILGLLFDPQVPGGDPAADADRWVLLDASLSMEGSWEDGLARGRELESEGWRFVTFGDGVTGVGSEALDDGPVELKTVLSTALERAAEAGVREIVVLSDLRLQDGLQVQAALEALPLDVSFEAIGGDGVNAGIGAFEVPDAPRREESRSATLDLFASGTDSVDLEIREEGVLVASRRVAAPAPGFRLTVDVELPPPTGEGRVRYTAGVIATGDTFSSDDEAVSYAVVGHEEGALVLVSLRPDWEARYLLPVLGQVSGLNTRGYLRVGPDRFLTMGRAVDRTEEVDSATVRAAAADAALLVIQGVDGRADDFGRGLVERAGGRVILFPVDAGGAAMAEVPTSASRDGEWYASQDLRPSPLAGDLAGLALQGLPPLTDLLPLARDAQGEVPLHLQLAGTGTGQGALLLRRRGGGRQAVALASGFWRWAAREGEARRAYRSLWSGVAGWLLTQDGTSPAQEPRPSQWVYERGESVSFQLPGDSASESHVVLEREGTPVFDTVLAAGGTATLGSLPPGSYQYRVANGAGEDGGVGRFDVAHRTEEMLPARFAAQDAEGTLGGRGVVDAQGRPLRTMLWPYLLILGLLCIEWIARRRAGLR